ncbi:hypothetical protein [Streptomyces sp. NPDC057287]
MARAEPSALLGTDGAGKTATPELVEPRERQAVPGEIAKGLESGETR